MGSGIGGNCACDVSEEYVRKLRAAGADYCMFCGRLLPRACAKCGKMILGRSRSAVYCSLKCKNACRDRKAAYEYRKKLKPKRRGSVVTE